MTHIKVTRGLDIPIKGKPEGAVKPLILSGEVSPLKTPQEIALDLSSFEDIKFKLLAKEGERVKLGQPLTEDKEAPGRYFVSPAGGVIKEIRRGLKRRLLDIVIKVDEIEEIEQTQPVPLHQLSPDQLLNFLKTRGALTHIRQRPFNLLVNPTKKPRHIYVKAVESAPFVPPAELQVEGYEKEFQLGLDALAKLTKGQVHLVYLENTTCRSFLDAQNVNKHTVEGPYPVSNFSVHIQNITPILSAEDVIWTLRAHDVVLIGYLLLHGRYFVDRVISIAGPGVVEDRIGYFKVREGFPIEVLISGRIKKGHLRFISGDVLTGKMVDSEDFLGFDDYCFCVIPENTSREFLHFFRLGINKYTNTGAYLSGHFNQSKYSYDFTTSQHGENRAFIDGSVYDKVMPLKVPTMHLVKAILAEDYDLAADLGLLEVDSEDFALPTFICPSKIEMIDIVKKGLRRYAADILK